MIYREFILDRIADIWPFKRIVEHKENFDDFCEHVNPALDGILHLLWGDEVDIVDLDYHIMQLWKNFSSKFYYHWLWTDSLESTPYIRVELGEAACTDEFREKVRLVIKKLGQDLASGKFRTIEDYR